MRKFVFQAGLILAMAFAILLQGCGSAGTATTAGTTTGGTTGGGGGASTPSALSITVSSLPSGRVGSSYLAALTATGGTGPYTWSIVSGALPGALTLSATTGAISGTPSTGGDFALTFQVKDTNQQTASKALTLSISTTALDAYGGSLSVSCASATGWFHTELIGNRWWLCTPLGHGYFQQGVQNITLQNDQDSFGRNNYSLALAKYGGNWEGWADATARRLQSWGFNSIDVGANPTLFPWLLDSAYPVDDNGLHTIPTKLPQIEPLSPAKDAVRNQTVNSDNGAGSKVLATEGVKNLVTGWSALYNGWRYGMVPDYYDTRVYTMLDKRLDPNSHIEGLSQQFTSPYLNYVIGFSIEDGDQVSGAGFITEPSFKSDIGDPGNVAPEAGWTFSTMAPVMTSYYNYVQNLYMYTTDTTVYSKKGLRDWLAAKYGSISALNSAWGSNYTTFDSTGTEISGEAVGTPDGSTAAFTHTLGNLVPSRFSTQLLVNGTPVAGDPGNPANVHDVTQGSIVGPQVSGTLTYGTGALSVSFSMKPVTLNWLASDGSTVTAETQVQHGLWTGAKVTITGTTNYNVTNAAITVVDPWHFTFAKAGSFAREHDKGSVTALLPQTGDTLTVNYVQNGYRLGTGFLDEDGRHTAWIGSDPQFLSNTASNVAADFRAFLVSYAGLVFGNNAQILHARCPGMLYIAQFGGYSIPPRQGTLEGAAPYVDLFQAADQKPYTQAMLDFMQQHWNKPWLQGIYITANADSAMFQFAGPMTADMTTQASKGQKYYDLVTGALNASFSSTGVHPYVGFGVWDYYDMRSEASNWGLVSWGDNAYDGIEDVSQKNVPCSPPFNILTSCGGEPAYPTWQANATVAVPGGVGVPGNRIQVNVGGTYYMFEVTAAGKTGSAPPSWPTAIGASVTDGSATWKNVGIKANPNGFGDIISKVKEANALWRK